MADFSPVGVPSDEPVSPLLPPVLGLESDGCRIAVRREPATGELWLEDQGASEQWRARLDADLLVWRAAPSRPRRCWVLAGLIRPPSATDVQAVTVALEDGRIIRGVVVEEAWLAVLPPEATHQHPCVLQYGPGNRVLERDQLRESLTEYLGSNPDHGHWTAYARY